MRRCLAIGLLCYLAALPGGCGSSNDSDSASGTVTDAASGSRLPGTGEPSETDAATRKETSFDRESAIAAAERLEQNGQLAEAAAQLEQAIIADPSDVEVLFRLAQLRAEQGNLASAVELLEDIPPEHPEAGLAALGQAADWQMNLGHYDKAERKYRDVLKHVDNFAHAHRQLAYLLNRQGRRFEAADHLRTLCRLGDIREDELHALMVVGHALFDDPQQRVEGRRPYHPIGDAAYARMLYTASRYVDALERLEPTVRSGDAVPANVAFYGLLAVEAQDPERFQWWLSQCDEQVRHFAEYWAALGAHQLSERQFPQAVRALGEALKRDPTNVSSMRRISQALTAMGREEQADRWMERYVTQRDTTLASNAIGEASVPDLESYQTVIDGLEKLSRPLEAATWRLFQAFHRQASKAEVETLNEQRLKLAASDNAFPSEQESVCGLKLANYPLPDLEVTSATALATRSQQSIDETVVPPVLVDVAKQVGLEHTYRIATQPQSERFALYQSLGGGAAAFDYDRDGNIDLYLAQGASVPPEMTGRASNQLMRNLQGQFRDQTTPAEATEYRYTIGVTAGDWNQDGFEDLVVMNIGNKALLINQGDGTFKTRIFDEDPERKVLPSSVAMADLSGDRLPDLFALHYVEDKTMLNRPPVNEKGEIQTVSPASFVPGVDRIYTNDGRGRFAESGLPQLSPDAASTGLGMVVTNWDGQNGNDVFVGNDVRPNQMWVLNSEARTWQDVATLTGCAHGIGGVETASMGIAVADYDGSGTPDIHITNFYSEPVSLFMNRGGSFEDRCVQYRLHEESLRVLGFGSQAIDYNNDGRPDIAVTNGNIEKAPGEPLHQSPQLFANLGRRFELMDVEDPSGYWQGKYLGRGMARLDFNRDGRQDLLITHLDQPTALVANQTETDAHHLTLEIVGTRAERDAIGTRVDVYVGERVQSNWKFAGDGYLCRNEPTVTFGLGDATGADKVVVTWPDGSQQTFNDVEADQRHLCIEGHRELFELEK